MGPAISDYNKKLILKICDDYFSEMDISLISDQFQLEWEISRFQNLRRSFFKFFFSSVEKRSPHICDVSDDVTARMRAHKQSMPSMLPYNEYEHAL